MHIFVLCWIVAPFARAEPLIAFNQDVLPVLSNNCFPCHGPDSSARKADLRLDIEERAKQPLKSGPAPIVPNNPSGSALIKRIFSADPDEQMPPPSSTKQLTDQEREVLRRWIAQGAQWQPFWSFIFPDRSPLPKVSYKKWPRNPIDHFVLNGLESRKLTPSPEADRYTLIRRASLALTGLPPTPEEIEHFLQDTDPDEYERLVDRLLASQRYGEHMARNWLDLARYADTNGYAADIERTMWRYRDWVIGAFNGNMPFDQFTIEQLAGDVLPNPTLDQRIATGFNRNHPIMMEGGAIFEEYRVMNVVDRVNTTATTWLGLTVMCAQCHDHKYDPVSQREFYQLYAFFNNVSEEESKLFGTELDGNSIPRIKAPLPAQHEEQVRIEAALKDVRARITRPIAEIDTAQMAWEVAERNAISQRWTALDATVNGDDASDDVAILIAITTARELTALQLDIAPGKDLNNPVLDFTEMEFFIAPIADGADDISIKFAESTSSVGIAKSAYDGNADTAWRIEATEETVRAVFAFTSPIGFADGTRIRLVLRGKGIAAGVQRMRLSVSSESSYLPATLGQWFMNGPFIAQSGEEALATEHVDPNRVDLAASYDDGRAKWISVPGGLSDGTMHSLAGKTCATYFHRTITAPAPRLMELALDNRNAVKLWVNGRLVLDKEAQRGEVGPQPAPVTIELRAGDNNILVKTVDFYDFNSHNFFFARKGENLGPMPLSIEAILLRDEHTRSEVDVMALRAFYRSRHWDGWTPLHEQELDLAWSAITLDKQIPTTMVMQDLDTPRPANVLVRGQYDQPGEPVSPGVPAALNRWSGDAPNNRLGLAQWIVAPENPLTARVAVNRLWQWLWGEGIVRTPDDFGMQGERPDNPELLDWLACEFRESGWDVKHMQRLIVTSAAFRQASRLQPEQLTVDPENRLFSRGPRYRLDAEMIRDAALASGGLLVEKLGGPSVKPYQPPGLWKDVAYGGGGLRYTAQEFIQDHGDNLYRRSMYTFWKRAAAPPGMLLFDAPNREICTAERSRSNTPVQALALMNDVQYIEAARGVAERIMQHGGSTTQDRIIYAGMLTLGRPPTSVEASALLQQFNDQLSDYRATPEAALALVQTGESKFRSELDAAELAAWTLVANALLNSDAAVSQL